MIAAGVLALAEGQSALFNPATGFVSIAAAVPEPGTLALAAFGLVLAGRSARRRR